MNMTACAYCDYLKCRCEALADLADKLANPEEEADE